MYYIVIQLITVYNNNSFVFKLSFIVYRLSKALDDIPLLVRESSHLQVQCHHGMLICLFDCVKFLWLPRM